jgi:hypothetical protein
MADINAAGVIAITTSHGKTAPPATAQATRRNPLLASRYFSLILISKLTLREHTTKFLAYAVPFACCDTG